VKDTKSVHGSEDKYFHGWFGIPLDCRVQSLSLSVLDLLLKLGNHWLLFGNQTGFHNLPAELLGQECYIYL
jgi:hypothetical protein